MFPIILIFHSAFAFGQHNKLDLMVVDGVSGDPVEGASILFKSKNEDSQKNGFEISDSDGKVRISLEGFILELTLEIFHLGYEPHKLVLDRGELVYHKVKIDLTPRAHEIPEVRIKGKAAYSDPLPDTLTYVVDSVATIATPGIVDVLERIEGMDISGDRITYDGRFVSRVFLDGLDLSSDSYMTMVEAISSSLIEEIDIVTDYHSNPILSDFESSVLVLNLKTRDSRDVKFSGRGSVGHSNRELLNLNADVTGVLPGLRTMVRYTRNSLSNRIYRPSGEFTYFNPLRLPIGSVHRNYEILPTYAPLGTSRYNLEQKIQGGSLMLGFRSGENWTFRSSSYLQESGLPHNHSMSTVNYLPDTLYKFGFEYHSQSEQHFFITEMEGERRTKNSYLNLQLQTSLPSQKSNHRHYYSGQISDTLVSRINMKDAFYLNPRMEFTKKLVDIVLDFRHEMEYTQFTELWENANKRTAALRSQRGEFTDQIHNSQFSAESKLLLRQHWGEDHRLSWGFAHGLLVNNKALDIKSEDGHMTEVENSESNYRTNNIYGVFQLQRGTERTRTSYRGTINLGVSSIQYLQDDSDIQHNTNPYMVLGLEFNKNFNRWSGLALDYSFANLPINSRYFVPKYFLTPNYQFVRSFEGRAFERNHQLSIAYTRNRVDRLFNFNTSIRLGYRPNAVIPEMEYFLTHSIATNRSGSSKNHQLDFNWEQDFIYSDWSLSGKLGTFGNRYSRKINHQVVESNFRNYSKGLKATYRSGGLELVLSGQLRYLILSADQVFQRSENWYWNTGAEVNYISLDERFKFGLRGKYYEYDRAGSSFTALDFTMDFFPSKKWQIRFTGHNLLNNKIFHLRRFSTEFDSNQLFPLRPRYFACIITFRF